MLNPTKLLLLLATAILPLTHADFLIYTEPPIPTSALPSFANPSEASSWTTSVLLNARLAYARHTSSLGAPYTSSSSSAASEIAAFASSAPANYSIPVAVTDPGTTTTFFSKPAWYTALPSGARAFKEQQVADQFSVVRSVIEARATTATGSKGAAAAAVQTPGAWEVRMGVLGAAAVAAFL